MTKFIKDIHKAFILQGISIAIMYYLSKNFLDIFYTFIVFLTLTKYFQLIIKYLLHKRADKVKKERVNK